MAGEFEDLQIKVSVDASGAESGLNALSSSIDKVSEDIAAFGEGANFADAISQGCLNAVNDVENLDAVIKGVIDGMSAESIDIAVGVDATGASEALKEVDDSLSKTQSSSESLHTELGTPFVITAGDAIDAFNNLGQSIINAENHVADFNKVSAGLSLIGGQTAQAYKDIAVGVSNEDMSIQQALETEKILSKQHVSSIDELKNLTEAWKNFGNANDEQASSLQQKLIPAWNQFGVTAQEQPKYFDALTTLFQTTNLSSSDFSSSIVRTGKDLSGFGLTLDQVAKLYLTMEESGYTGRKGMSALSGAIKDINDNAENTGTAVPKGDAALNALYKTIGISNDKVSEANKLFEASAGATDKWSEAMDKGDTSTEIMAAKVDKLTIGLKEAIAPMAPAASGVAAIASAGANLAIFDKFLAGGKISSGISGIAASLPLIGTAAAETEGGVVGLGAALGALGPITIAGAAIAAAGIAAYATNFGGFADNINESIALAQEAIQAFSEGDYEEAGKKMAESMASGFEALGDLLKDVISNLPELTVDAVKLLKGLEDGLKKVAKGAGEGFAIALQKIINSASVELNGLWSNIQSAFKGFSFESLGADAAKLIANGMQIQMDMLSGLFSSIEDAWKNGIDWGKLGSDAANLIVAGFKTVNPIVGSGVEGFVNQLTGQNTKMTTPGMFATPKTVPSSTGLQYVTAKEAAQIKYTAIQVPTSTTPISSAGTSQAEGAYRDALLKATRSWLDAQGKFSAETSKYTTLFEKNNADWVKTNKAALAATDSITASAKSTASKIKSYGSVSDALADTTLGVGDSFKVGASEYKKAIDTATGTAKLAAEEQGQAAELKRAQAKLDTAAEEERQKSLDALTKQQEEASKKVTAAQQKYADAIDKAAFDYQQAVKYATSPEQAASAKTAYQKKLDELLYSAGKEGVSLDGLNTAMQVNSDTVNNLKSTYTKANDDLKNQLRDLEAERQKKLASATPGKQVDTSAIDKKIAAINKEIKDNEAAISSATATVTKNTNAQKSSMGVLSASTDELRKKYIELSKIDPSIVAQMSREDLLRNIALYGDQIGDVNNQLGGSVDQLQKVAIEVSNIGATDAFSQIQNKFQDLKSQFESGAISQDQYLDGLRKASAETDTLSRSTNILKGSQKDAVLDFERNIKESLRRIEAGTYGAQPISAIGESIGRLGGTPSSAASTRAISSIDKLDDAYVKQGISAGKAAALQFVMNDALSDGNAKLSEAYSYLGAYNQATGQNIEVTQDGARKALDMMNALQQSNQLQQMYTSAMADGSISAQELTGIQGQQQVVQDALTQASQNALGPTGQLPGSLQAVADTVSAVLSQISNALANAQAAASQAQAAASQAQSAVSAALSAASQVSAAPSNTVNISNNQFGQITTVKDVARNAFSAMVGSF